jgi:hypothetical protein
MKSAARKAPQQQPARKPIDLYYWPTPNGWKITIMLEECGLAYHMIPVNIANGYLRIRSDPAISRPQDRQVLSAGRACAGRG